MAKTPAKQSQPYQEINGCTNALPAWQVIGLALVLSIEALMFYMIPHVV